MVSEGSQQQNCPAGCRNVDHASGLVLLLSLSVRRMQGCRAGRCCHLNLFLASPSVRRPKSLPDPYRGHDRKPAMKPPAATRPVWDMCQEESRPWARCLEAHYTVTQMELTAIAVKQAGQPRFSSDVGLQCKHLQQHCLTRCDPHLCNPYLCDCKTMGTAGFVPKPLKTLLQCFPAADSLPCTIPWHMLMKRLQSMLSTVGLTQASSITALPGLS